MRQARIGLLRAAAACVVNQEQTIYGLFARDRAAREQSRYILPTAAIRDQGGVDGPGRYEPPDRGGMSFDR